MFNAETAHKKVIAVQDKLRKIDLAVTTRLDEVNSKLDQNYKKIIDRSKKREGIVKNQFIMVGE